MKKRGDDITFLRRIVRGPADDSYGIEVAKLAGIPESVVARAKEILRSLDVEGADAVHGTKERFAESNTDVGGQMSLLPMAENSVIERLRTLDINTLTPIEALQTLYELAKEAQSM